MIEVHGAWTHGEIMNDGCLTKWQRYTVDPLYSPDNGGNDA